ncbi:sulfotransferase [Tateyamaria omphalii]|uniref:sulfotransferase n=1 Tax=Tateyamaria omphalii TaxID=299262 RepID=UPI001C991642|nr:sulfotransferase [Tateyamaria omphalii]MBY5934998.1 sulfotransferase [Tateyamaria omphalii]
MSVAALCLGLVAFIAVLRILHAQQVAGGIVETTQHALAVMMNSDIADEDKEAQVQRASIKLLGGFFWITGIGAAAIGASVLIVWGGAVLGYYAVDQAIAVALGWPFLLGSTAAAIALWIGLDKLRKGPVQDATRAEVPYGPLDKAVHDFAFSSPERQVRLGRFETRFYRRRLDAETVQRPVFITSLPRAGTTIMLEGLARLPHFASATYQHMPFTLSPLLSANFSRIFRKAGNKNERAHGDGIEVNMDSPEAFEEMLWMAFWPQHFEGAYIPPWSAEDRKPEFERFLRTHMSKIVATKAGATRYISKNNANIARLELLEALFPDASIIVPIRNPRAQVQSLLRQHRRFADLHAREPFARRYMEGIGHFEFGAALRPIEFGTRRPDLHTAGQIDFWLRYWIDAYQHVLATAGPRTIFVDHDALCSEPERLLPELAASIELDEQDSIATMAGLLRAPHPAPDLPDASRNLMQRADILHEELCSQAIGSARASIGKVIQ